MRRKLEIVQSKLDNISPYSNGMPGPSLISTSVDPSQTRKELKDRREQKIGGVDIWGLNERHSHIPLISLYVTFQIRVTTCQWSGLLVT